MVAWLKHHRSVGLIVIGLIICGLGVGGYRMMRSVSLADSVMVPERHYWIVLPSESGTNSGYATQTLPTAIFETQSGRIKIYPLSQASDRAEITLGALVKLSDKQLAKKLAAGEIVSVPSRWRPLTLRTISDGSGSTVGESLTWPIRLVDSSGVRQFRGHFDFSQPLLKTGHPIKIAGHSVNGYLNRDGTGIIRLTTAKMTLDRYRDKRVKPGW
ncbi:hypothetical protein [uncultured Secundilactobacillus sp.]|uniref:hypothetical protein n=1 Tax=uncultured Secundilactobacillus sp. TaxID=2813935 RepID=UPI002586510B|nr:hypothetical protein [uncultured Secundilactobacillus sp.]